MLELVPRALRIARAPTPHWPRQEHYVSSTSQLVNRCNGYIEWSVIDWSDKEARVDTASAAFNYHYLV